MVRKLLPILAVITIVTVLFASSVSAAEITTGKNIREDITLPEIQTGKALIDEKIPAALRAPVITQQPKGITVKEGEPITLSLVAEGIGLKYRWGNAGYYKEESTGSANSTMVYADSDSASFTIAEAADYNKHNKLTVFCEVSNQNGSVISEPAIITVVKKEIKPVLAEKAAFKTHPQSVTVNEGESITFSVTTGGENLNYRWSVEQNGETQTYFSEDYNKSTFTLTSGAVYDEHNGAIVSCYIFNDVADAVSDSATVTVVKQGEGKSPVITRQPQDIEVYPGEYCVMDILAQGENMSYRWVIESKEGTRVVEGSFGGGVSSSVFVFDPAIYQKHNGTKVTCTVSNEYGSVTSRTATATVNYGAGGFIDIPCDVWFFEDVKRAAESGLINGVSEIQFAPYENITIGATIKLAACLHELHNTGKVTLTNGSVNWYDTYVEYAEANGIILRDEWDEAYNKTATRAEFVWIMYKALPAYSYIDPNPVADNAIPDVPSDIGYSGPIYVFYRAGILTGSDAKGTFNPDKPIQRCEVAAVLTRMVDETARKFIALPVPDLGLMNGSMCWITGGNRFVFFTEIEGKAAIVHGLWESEPQKYYIYRAALAENILTLTLYYPPTSYPDNPEIEPVEEQWGSIMVDISGLDVDGKVKMSVDGEAEWKQYYPAGPTMEDGYNEIFNT